MGERSSNVLVTGAGSGIGRAVAVRLASRGYRVHAGARRDADLEALAAVPRVLPLRLDVCHEDEVEAARRAVEAAGGPFAAVIHSAGAGGIGYLHTFTDEEVRDLFETNVFGVVRVTRVFLPLLLASRGHVIVVGSQGGHVSMRFMGPYTMTKHALEAYVVALHEEVSPEGVRVALVDPGGVVTPIGEKSLPGDRARFERARPPFQETARRVLAALGGPPSEFDPTRPESETNRNPCPPDAVAEVIESVLESPRPRLRTIVGTRWEGGRIFRELARRMDQTNRSPQHRHTREEIAAYLDEARREGDAAES